MATKTNPHRRGFYAYSLILSPIRHFLSPWHPTQSSADGALSVPLPGSVLRTVGSPAPPPSWAAPLRGGPLVGSEAPEEDLEPQSLGEGQSRASGQGGEAGRCFRPRVCWEQRAGAQAGGSAATAPAAPGPHRPGTGLRFPGGFVRPRLSPWGGEGSRCPLAHPWKLQKSNLGWGRGR